MENTRRDFIQKLGYGLVVPSTNMLSTIAKPPLGLELAFEMHINVGKPIEVGVTPQGTRRIIPILGGSFKGEKIQGTVLEGGADWQLIRKDGVAEIEAKYTLKTDDGTLIYIINKGLRHGPPEVMKRLAKGEKVDSSEYYFRTTPVFETNEGKYDWLMRSVFVAKGIRNPENVVIEVWKLL